MIRLPAIVAFLVVTATIANAACMKPDQPEAAEGRLALGTFRDALGRPEKAFILRLSAAACLDAEAGTDRVDAARTLHVYPSDRTIQSSMRRMVGAVVAVRGRPFASHTAHHHAPIVMEVSAIRAK